MFSLRKPRDEFLLRLAERGESEPFTYREVGDSRSERAPADFAVGHVRVRVGEGIEQFHLACQAIVEWRMFPEYVELLPAEPPLETDQCVALRMQALGLWVSMLCRIVYTIDDVYPNGALKFGFAYGTLPGHVERGEERFMVEWLPDDSVWYDLYAFSRPQALLAWLGMPIARNYQRRFAIDSCRRMTEAVRQLASERSCAESAE